MNCGECRHWQVAGSQKQGATVIKFGNCRRYPPQVIALPQQGLASKENPSGLIVAPTAIFPTTGEAVVCGEFAPILQ